jgi:hypothetical protein
MTEQTSETRQKELEDENELLLLQLHQMQEELASYFQKYQALEKEQGRAGSVGSANSVWVDDQLPEALAEVARLKALVETQSNLHRIESTNALNARLGDILIKSVSNTGTLLAVPAKLLKIWRESDAKDMPAALGGKSCDTVIAAYQDGGFEAVGKLLSTVTAPAMKANAYTTLARSLMKGHRAEAAEAARLAYEEDPRPYRLKWLAFKLHEADEVIQADAMLSALPADTSFSESEARQVDQVRREASSARLREAKKQTRFAEKRAEVEKQIKQLAGERDDQSKLAFERGRELDSLKAAKVRLEQDKAQLEQDKAQLEQGKSALADRQDELQQQLAERGRELDSLKAAKVRLEQERSALTGRGEESAKLAVERLKRVDELQQQIQIREAGEADLMARQQLMREEMVRAEAQLDLIKEMLLREPGL